MKENKTTKTTTKTKETKSLKSTKIIFVTGGVVSGIGKGIAAASIGNLLKNRGYKVFIQKLDPYLNIDPGVLSPYEHGEVYVTNDGGETDLDLGHYERFTGELLTKDSNYTSGKICQMVFENERKGKYEGKTVQIIPHLTNEIQNIIQRTIDKHQPDFHIVEIGGTVGDIESNAFVIAASMIGHRKPGEVYYIHTTFVPYLNVSKEFKTKPTQQSLSLLASQGIRANMVLLRAQSPIGKNICSKIAHLSNLPCENVVSLHDVENVYEVPLYLESQNVASTILNHFKLKNKKADLKEWESFVSKIKAPNKKKMAIGLVGKYVELEDAYKSIKEALIISAAHEGIEIDYKWISAESINKNNVGNILKQVDGVIVLPGFGERGFDGKLATVEYTRTELIPTLGICYGMQAMTINQAFKVGIKDATSSEISKKGTFVLDIIEGKNSTDIGGTLRLGSDDIEIDQKNTLAYRIYGQKIVQERSRHRYEVNPNFVQKLQDDNFIFSGFHPETRLVEICELKNHPFYLGVQYHPEFNAQPLKPHKLFTAFIKSILETKIK